MYVTVIRASVDTTQPCPHSHDPSAPAPLQPPHLPWHKAQTPGQTPCRAAAQPGAEDYKAGDSLVGTPLHNPGNPPTDPPQSAHPPRLTTGARGAPGYRPSISQQAAPRSSGTTRNTRRATRAPRSRSVAQHAAPAKQKTGKIKKLGHNGYSAAGATFSARAPEVPPVVQPTLPTRCCKLTN